MPAPRETVASKLQTVFVEAGEYVKFRLLQVIVVKQELVTQAGCRGNDRCGPCHRRLSAMLVVC